MMLQIESTSSESTLEIAEKIGRNLKGGEVIELISDVGGGKTTFVKGLAKGMGCVDPVVSPTFTISREYKADNIELHHFDFYRLTEPGVVRDELAESIHDPKIVVAIEWADIVHGVLPADKLRITITSPSEDGRSFAIEAGPKHQHVLEGVQ